MPRIVLNVLGVFSTGGLLYWMVMAEGHTDEQWFAMVIVSVAWLVVLRTMMLAIFPRDFIAEPLTIPTPPPPNSK